MEIGMDSAEELSDKAHLTNIFPDFLDCWGRGRLDPPI